MSSQRDETKNAAVRGNNNEAGGNKFEMSDIGYIIKSSGYIKDLASLENITLKTQGSVPIRVRDVATVQMSGETRLGIFDVDGQGKAVGGIVVMRYRENADEVIRNVKAKMTEAAKGLPEGVKFRLVYDRSGLIEEVVNSVKGTLIEEMIVASIMKVQKIRYTFPFLEILS